MASDQKRQRRPKQEQATASAERKGESKRSATRSLWEWTKSLAMGFVLFLLLRTFLVQTFTITSGSMENTLLVGDFLVLSKSAYGATVPGIDVQLPGYTQPRRGDIVVFRGHHEPIDLVKRLVGMPGDTLAMRDGTLYVNGVVQNEPYVRHTDPMGDGTHPWMMWQAEHLVSGVDRSSYRPTRDNWGPIVVPAGKHFVMGDNRDESLDSRYWGFVEPRALKGKALVLYFSYDRDAFGPLPFLNHVRWGRIGDRIQ
jgi:signal peptidase I